MQGTNNIRRYLSKKEIVIMKKSSCPSNLPCSHLNAYKWLAVMGVAQLSITTRQSTSGPLVTNRYSKLAQLKKKLRFPLRDLAQAHESHKWDAST
jgi:hypothetical protein